MIEYLADPHVRWSLLCVNTFINSMEWLCILWLIWTCSRLRGQVHCQAATRQVLTGLPPTGLPPKEDLTKELILTDPVAPTFATVHVEPVEHPVVAAIVKKKVAAAKKTGLKTAGGSLSPTSVPVTSAPTKQKTPRAPRKR